ncbi:Alpha/Beta hydrolase fold [Fusarium oxysporum f. sp. vasinfectum]|nr:Alpha/Beta hydrolase fold [Fusarium oxysporum f. sp. vasinfectum]
MVHDKPVIVIVHGAWQRPSQYDALKQGLASRGFSVVQPESATAGTVISEVCGKTYLDDVTVIRAALEQPLAAGKEIVLVCHSYGGIPGSAAAEGYQVHERHEKGLPGGIKHIVYLAAFALPRERDVPVVSHWRHGGVISLGQGAQDALFNDFDSETANRLLAGCVYQSTVSLETPSMFAATDVSVPKTYVACENDHALPFDAQIAMSNALGNFTNVIKVRSGHSVYQNMEVLPEVLAAIETAAAS